MAVRKRKDGCWVVYHKARDGSGKIVEEYFGKGIHGEDAARARNEELNLAFRGPQQRKPKGVVFWDVAQAYVMSKSFNQNALKHVKIRLMANILPFFGDKSVRKALTYGDMARYARHRQG